MDWAHFGAALTRLFGVVALSFTADSYRHDTLCENAGTCFMTCESSAGARAGDFVADAGAIPVETPVAPASKISDIRIPALDGLRGLMTLFVIVSHF
jgi:hypothetical protein